MYVPYISPYEMGGKGDLKTIKMDPGIFDNCPGYDKNHPFYRWVFEHDAALGFMRVEDQIFPRVTWSY